MSEAPEKIVMCLDALELFSDDPVKVTRLVGELRERLHALMVDVARDLDCKQETIDDLRGQLNRIVRLPV